MKKIIYTNQAPEPVGPYSQAILVDNTLYCSGQIAINPETGNVETKGNASFANGAFVVNNTGAAVNGGLTVNGNAAVTGGLNVGTDVVAGGTSLKETAQRVESNSQASYGQKYRCPWSSFHYGRNFDGFDV